MGSELRSGVYQRHKDSRSHPPHYTFRSMPRTQSSRATALKMESAREATRMARRPTPNKKRLSKRVVLKADGRYLIYYGKA